MPRTSTDFATPRSDLINLALDLAAIQRPSWSAVSAGIPAWHPRMESDPPADPPKNDPPPENVVGEALRKQQAAEKRAEDLQKRLDALEDRDRSDLEKAQRRADQAEQRATELEARLNQVERGGWVRDAAARSDFINPDLAARLVDLSEITDERSAARAVKALADDDSTKHLVKAKPDPTPADQLKQVLKDGKTPPDDPSGTPPEPEPGLGRLQAAYASAPSQT